jgi:hypothetical protein
MRKERNRKARDKKLLAEAWLVGLAMAALFLVALRTLITGTIR